MLTVAHATGLIVLAGGVMADAKRKARTAVLKPKRTAGDAVAFREAAKRNAEELAAIMFAVAQHVPSSDCANTLSAVRAVVSKMWIAQRCRDAVIMERDNLRADYETQLGIANKLRDDVERLQRRIVQLEHEANARSAWPDMTDAIEFAVMAYCSIRSQLASAIGENWVRAVEDTAVKFATRKAAA